MSGLQPTPTPLGARLEPLVELDRLVVAVRLRRHWCLIGALVGVLLGLAVPRLHGGSSASAAVLVSRGDRPGPLKDYNQQSGVLQAAGAEVIPGVMPSTGAALCSGGAVAGPAAARLGISPAALAGSYSCSDAAPDVIKVTARSPNPQQAQRTVAAVTEAFLGAYRAQQQQNASTQASDLLAQRGRLEQNLTEVTRSLAASTYPAQIQSLEDLQKDLLTRMDDLTGRATDLQTTATTAAAGSRVVDPPIAVPDHHKLILPVAGGLLGLLGGAAAAVLGVIITDRPLRRREVATALGEPIALDVARIRHGRRRRLDPAAAAGLLARLLRDGHRVLVLESGCPAVALDVTAAAAGQLEVRPTAALGGAPARVRGAQTRVAGAVQLAPPESVAGSAAQLQIGSLRPAGPWAAADATDRVAVLLVRPGHESAAGLAEGAEDLRSLGIAVAAVFLVDPDRHDRSDGFAGAAFERMFQLRRGVVT
jgi:hypothetical protein